jgi:hypothetical protein
MLHKSTLDALLQLQGAIESQYGVMSDSPTLAVTEPDLTLTRFGDL